jgi:hypothetical protein
LGAPERLVIDYGSTEELLDRLQKRGEPRTLIPAGLESAASQGIFAAAVRFWEDCFLISWSGQPVYQYGSRAP